jgi:mannose-6-phosphate isomerase
MLRRISGELKSYPWGSKNLIPDYFAKAADSQVISEIWFGSHDASPSIDLSTGEPITETLGKKLSFLMKLLSCESALSIQVHPNSEQAKAGFERENQLGLVLEDPTRNYKDQSHKPELIIALTPFEALAGFRPLSEIKTILREFGEQAPAFNKVLSLCDEADPYRQLFQTILESKDLVSSFQSEIDSSVLSGISKTAAELTTRLLSQYPADTGALVSLLLNYLNLDPGQAVFVPAGQLHAYLSGLGVEVMASSDNVIRGGLTSKHIDTPELLKIVEFVEEKNPRVSPTNIATGLVQYPVPVADFSVYRASVSGANLFADLDIQGESIVLCTAGEVAVGTSLEEREVIRAGDAVLLAKAKKFSLTGSGTVFVVFGN